MASSSSKAIHFFKTMLRETLLERNLKIPQEFVREHGECLSDTMFLNLPNGAKWKVNLETHDDGSVWFHQGWKEFAEHHSLADGNFLVFGYHGRSHHLDVVIFGVDAMEIDYPNSSNKLNHRKRTNNCEDERRKRQRSNNGNDKDQSNSNLQDTALHQRVKDSKGINMTPNEGKRNIDHHPKRPSKSNCEAHEAGGSTSFMARVNTHGTTTLPTESLKSYVKPGGQDVTLVVGDKEWKVKLFYYPHKNTTCLSAGWSAFVKEHKLKVGDVCFFKLVNGSPNMVFNVSIPEASKETKLEVGEHMGMFKGTEAVARVTEEMEKLVEWVFSALQLEGCQYDKEYVMLTRLLMRQLLTLDGIEAEGVARLERKAEVHRVLACLDALDAIKALYASRVGNRRNGKKELRNSKVTQDWEWVAVEGAQS